MYSTIILIGISSKSFNLVTTNFLLDLSGRYNSTLFFCLFNDLFMLLGRRCFPSSYKSYEICFKHVLKTWFSVLDFCHFLLNTSFKPPFFRLQSRNGPQLRAFNPRSLSGHSAKGLNQLVLLNHVGFLWISTCFLLFCSCFYCSNKL